VLSRNLVNEEALTHWGLSRQKKERKKEENYVMDFVLCMSFIFV
jgi:hypothetical protein